MTGDELISIINQGKKKLVSEADVFSDQIDPVILNRIDKVFKRGLHFYLDPKTPELNRDASIFFRKSKFGSDLNIGAKRIVNQFEDFKISLLGLAKLADLNIERKIPSYNINHNPREIAKQVRKILYPEFCNVQRDFLKSLITKFAEFNILVFEFLETHNKKEKANIDGVFLSPNVIVLKRHQDSFSREILTLIHELGHYLLNEEEIEEVSDTFISAIEVNQVEEWCYDFAYHFLVGEYDIELENISEANSSNDYHFDLISTISKGTHLSRLALFTRLLKSRKISRSEYFNVKSDLEARYKERKEEEKKRWETKRLLEMEAGKKPIIKPPKPIDSPLFITTIRAAYYDGLINEQEVCQSLNIKPAKLESILK